jgi:hypothetical protein
MATLSERFAERLEDLHAVDAKVLASIGALLAQYPSYVQAVESCLIKAGAWRA